jgi:hypothetical protein
MKFGRIDVENCSTTTVDHENLDAAKRACGLRNVDFVTLTHTRGVGGVQIVVDEFGLYAPVNQQRYFSIGRRLFAGNALLFAYEALGNTIDFEQIDNIGVTFFGGAAAVERAIAAGIIDRPTFSVNGETVWQWPQPRPDLNAVAERSTKGDRTT